MLTDVNRRERRANPGRALPSWTKRARVNGGERILEVEDACCVRQSRSSEVRTVL